VLGNNRGYESRLRKRMLGGMQTEQRSKTKEKTTRRTVFCGGDTGKGIKEASRMVRGKKKKIYPKNSKWARKGRGEWPKGNRKCGGGVAHGEQKTKKITAHGGKV